MAKLNHGLSRLLLQVQERRLRALRLCNSASNLVVSVPRHEFALVTVSLWPDLSSPRVVTCKDMVQSTRGGGGGLCEALESETPALEQGFEVDEYQTKWPEAKKLWRLVWSFF